MLLIIIIVIIIINNSTIINAYKITVIFTGLRHGISDQEQHFFRIRDKDFYPWDPAAGLGIMRKHVRSRIKCLGYCRLIFWNQLSKSKENLGLGISNLVQDDGIIYINILSWPFYSSPSIPYQGHHKQSFELRPQGTVSTILFLKYKLK